ncbi:protein PIGBOS1 [Ambystoma mexicanum]|uniref:protein PIGBOS1 n=1 Tax=Ambystoma mexicanum TaxID=8296 RepID=UPI0037E8651F
MYRRISLPQMMLATVIGIAGGYYIYKPIYEQYNWEQRTLKNKAPPVQEGQKKSMEN